MFEIIIFLVAYSIISSMQVNNEKLEKKRQRQLEKKTKKDIKMRKKHEVEMEEFQKSLEEPSRRIYRVK